MQISCLPQNISVLHAVLERETKNANSELIYYKDQLTSAGELLLKKYASTYIIYFCTILTYVLHLQEINFNFSVLYLITRKVEFSKPHAAVHAKI